MIGVDKSTNCSFTFAATAAFASCGPICRAICFAVVPAVISNVLPSGNVAFAINLFVTNPLYLPGFPMNIAV